MSNLQSLIDSGVETVVCTDSGGLGYWTEGKTYTVLHGGLIMDNQGDTWGYGSSYDWPSSPMFKPSDEATEVETAVTLDSIADSIVELVLEKLQAKLGELK